MSSDTTDTMRSTDPLINDKPLPSTDDNLQSQSIALASIAEEADAEFIKERMTFALSTDSYDAVIAATFGGIILTLPSDDRGGHQFIRVHPFLVFMLSLVLCVAQVTCMSCLVLDMHMENVWETSYEEFDPADPWKGFEDNPQTQMKTVVRSVMVALLQIIGLKELLGAMRPMCLVLNPISWFELHRPAHVGTGLINTWGFSIPVCLPLCVMSQLCQFAIAYYVLTLSMSIVIVAVDVKEIIFNGLVVTFLADLDEFVWAAASAVLHLDHKYFEDYRFLVRDQGDDKNKTDTGAKSVTDAREKARGTWKIWLYRGKGGKVAALENLVIFCILTCIYIRQLFVFLHAMNTGILPVARDVCEIYRGMMQEGRFLTWIKVWVLDLLTIQDYPSMVKTTVEKVDGFHDACLADTPHHHSWNATHCMGYTAGPFDCADHYISQCPIWIIGSIVVLLCFFLGPQLIFSNFQTVLVWLGHKQKEQGPVEYQRGLANQPQ